MSPPKRRIFAIVAWVILLVGTCILSADILVALILEPAVPWLQSRGWANTVGTAYNVVVLSGLAITCAAATFLGIAGKLPWTSARQATWRGFPLDSEIKMTAAGTENKGTGSEASKGSGGH